MHIEPHSQSLNLGGERRPPLPFLKIKRSVLILGKGPDCVHLWVNVVLRVSRKKNSKLFPCGATFVFDEMFIEVP